LIPFDARILFPLPTLLVVGIGLGQLRESPGESGAASNS